MCARTCLHRFSPRPYLLLIALLCSLTQILGRMANVSSGPECAAALADPTVDRIILLGDLHWRDSDWVGYDIPIRLLRNVTLTGASEDPDKWPLLVTGPISAKIQLGDGVALKLTNVVVDNTARTYQSLAPGFDVMARCSPREVGLLQLMNATMIFRVCYSAKMFGEYVGAAARPAQYPGRQVVRYGLSQEGCISTSNATAVTNGSNASGSSGGVTSDGPSALPPAVRIQRQCCALRGSFDDVAVYSMDYQPDVQRQVPNGIVSYLSGVTFICLNQLSDDCVRKLGSLGCWLAFLNGSALATATDGTAPVNVTAPMGVPLPALLGGLLGGLLVLVIIAGLSWRRIVHSAVLVKAYFVPPFSKRGPDEPKHSALGDTVRLQPGSDDAAGQSVASATKAAAIIHDLASCSAHGGCVGEWTSDARKGVSRSSDYCRQRASDSSTASRPTCTTAQAQAQAQAVIVQLTAGSEDDLDQPPGQPGQQDPHVVVTPLSPPRPGLELGSDTSNEVRLLPRVLGKGSYGKVVEGEYRGLNVAVKLLPDCNWALWGLVPPVAVAADAAPGGPGVIGVLSPGGAGPPATPGGEVPDGHGNGANTNGATPAEDPKPAPAANEFTSCGPLRGTVRDCLMLGLAQEVEVLGRCDHPNVVRLLAACLAPPRVCLVMELMDVSLDRMLYGTSARLLPMPTVVDLATDVARGLEYLHPTIVHRDLKPANVLIKLPSQSSDDRMVAKLTDFGLSRLQYGTVPTKNPEVGTPEYMAPELYNPKYTIVQHYVDIYSFGVLLWTMLTGKPPWAGVKIVTMAYRITMLNERLPLNVIPYDRRYGRLLVLMQQCWDQDPRRRPAAAELVKELETLRQEIQGGLRRNASHLTSKPTVV